MLDINQEAPDFALPNQDGDIVKLSDFNGSWRVVYFYPKDDTPGCTDEACGFRDRLNELQKAGVIVLGISKDTVRSHKKFYDKFHLNFNILADPEHKVIEAYGAWQEKAMFGRKYMGTQRMTLLVDPKGVIRKIYPSVAPKGHEHEVLKDIESMI